MIDPYWTFDPVSCDPEKFFQEAGITEKSVASLKGRFEKYSSLHPDAGESYLTFEDWHNFNTYYCLCRPEDEHPYFRTMDQSGEGRLQWSDFLLGCAAANPATPHILNSITGYLRAQYIFRFYNVSCSGALEYEELHQLLADTRRHVSDDTPDALQQYSLEVAQELGKVSAVTLRISNSAGLVCDMRASTKWTGWRIKREIARQLQVPVEGQELLLGEERLLEDTVLETLLPTGATLANLTLVEIQWERWPVEAAPRVSDGIAGLERLVHVSFQSFYQALTEEQLRGTSRLFRFKAQIISLRRRAGQAPRKNQQHAASMGGA
jgi:hypothetical protein